jgi:hypothetical protein
MNWPLAIARNRTALLAVVAAIVALLGGREAGNPIARRLRNAALALLRPAESAARRLIVISARGLTLAPRPAPVFAGAPGGGQDDGRQGGPQPQRLRAPAFRLFDPRKRFVLRLAAPRPVGAPRIRTFWAPPSAAPAWLSPAAPAPPPAAAPSDPDAPVPLGRLLLRLAALQRALADLPGQARRLARWRARRGAGLLAQGPLRLGRPPGHRPRSGRAVDGVLGECHFLALDALRADTS